MRILLLSNLYPPCMRGGAEVTARDIADGLLARGHQVTVLTSWYGLPAAQQEGHIWRTLYSAEPAYFDPRGSPVQQLRHLRNYIQQYHSSKNAKELLRAVAATNPDVLYIWEMNGIGIISLLKALHLLTIPIVFHLGSYWWQYIHSPQTEYSHIRLRWLKKLFIGAVPSLTYTSLIAVSGAVKQAYIQAGGDPERIEIINSGIDPRFMDLAKTEHLDDKDFAENRLHLIYAGRIRREKGVLVLFKALDRLINEQGMQNLHLHIFGDGDQLYISELQAFLGEKQLTHAVTLHGKVPQDDLIKYYDLSEIMLVPSLWQEPFGLVVAEAMARGLPVIASDLGGPAEIITNGVDGLLVAPGNEQALAGAVRYLLENPDQREQLVQAAHTMVRNRFTIAENIRRAEQHLLQAVQGDHAHTITNRLGSAVIR